MILKYIEEYNKNRTGCYFSKYYFIIFFFFDKILIGVRMKKKIYIIALLSIFIDQVTKFIIINTFRPFTGKSIIKNIFELMYVKNSGAAWGILDNNLPILIFISIIALFLLYRYINKEKNITKLMIISYGLLMGGITGNLIDRVFRTYVVDFIHIYIFNYSYPVFNMADIFIVVGIILMLIEVVRGEVNAHKSR